MYQCELEKKGVGTGRDWGGGYGGRGGFRGAPPPLSCNMQSFEYY